MFIFKLNIIVPLFEMFKKKALQYYKDEKYIVRLSGMEIHFAVKWQLLLLLFVLNVCKHAHIFDLLICAKIINK